MINNQYNQYPSEPFSLIVDPFGDGYRYQITFGYKGHLYKGSGTTPTPEQAAGEAFDFYWRILREE